MARVTGVVRRGMRFRGIASRFRSSTKTPKAKARGIFGRMSQFAGIGRGTRGDLRK